MTAKRLGVVGIGWVSHPHIDAWLKTGYCDVVALCSRSKDKALNAVAQHGLTECRVYIDYAQMLQQENIDVVAICRRNASHAEQVIAAEVDEVMCDAGSFTGQRDDDATQALLLRFTDGTKRRCPTLRTPSRRTRSSSAAPSALDGQPVTRRLPL